MAQFVGIEPVFSDTAVPRVGVLAGESPVGPWYDPLGRALIAAGSVATEARDPGLLLDDDGQAYIVFGTWDFFIARLN